MAKAKYKVTDKVKIKVAPKAELFITEISEVTSMSGVETYYGGRLVLDGKMAGRIWMSEVELE